MLIVCYPIGRCVPVLTDCIDNRSTRVTVVSDPGTDFHVFEAISLSVTSPLQTQCEIDFDCDELLIDKYCGGGNEIRISIFHIPVLIQ